jgi:hypothetical protein
MIGAARIAKAIRMRQTHGSIADQIVRFSTASLPREGIASPSYIAETHTLPQGVFT